MRALQTWFVAVCLALWWRDGSGALQPGDVRAALLAGGRYSLQSALLLNSAERRDRELGYRLTGELLVSSAAHAPPGALPVLADPQPGDETLCFTLSETRLEVRGTVEWSARGSAWDAQRGAASTWCAVVRRGGALAALLLRAADPPDVRDYKRALASLYQFQGSPEDGVRGERNETDPVGTCTVSYEALGGSAVRKVKRACAGDEAAGASEARRATRVALAPAAREAQELYAEEVVTLHGALKVRSFHTLARLGPAPPGPAAPPPGLEPHRLPLEGAASLHDDEEEAALELDAALSEHSAALAGQEAGAGGTVGAARALLRLLPVLRRADMHALRSALERAEQDARVGLCRALGLAGTASAARAALVFTRLQEGDPLEPLARAFLEGFMLAESARRDAVLEVVRAASEARRAHLAQAALAAAAAAARGEGERAAVREAAARALARCRDAACLAARLLAFAHLRAVPPDAPLESALTAGGRAAAAALAALRAAPDLPPARLARLGQLATNASMPLEVRADALELLVSRRAAGAVRAAPLQLLEVASTLASERSRAAHELRRVLWQRLETLRHTPPVQELFRLLSSELRTWDARAHAGTSQVVVRETGWGGGAGGWRAQLDAVQVAAGGVLRRGEAALRLRPAARAPPPPPELQVEVWTRGLHALAGGDAPEHAGEDEPAAGGLALSVAGYRLRDVMLFDGQAELLGHVWAGSASAPTPVVRALRVAHAARGTLPLLAGCAVRVRARAATALALDAHAAVSLWQRTARGALSLRGALLAEAEARVRVQWGELHAAREFTAEPRLRITLALDFYSGVAACVRTSVPEHATEETLRLRSVLGARRLTVRRGAVARRSVPARTLALGPLNDAACRTLHAHDDDDDQ